MTTLSEGLKTIFLAGVGAVAVTAEKSKEIIDDLVKKGELTMEQGKVLNEELKRDIKEKVKETVTVQVVKEAPEGDILSQVDSMSREDRQALKEKLAAWRTPMKQPRETPPTANDAAPAGRPEETQNRLKEILQVLARHDIVKGMTPEKLRNIVEDLGPTFVKLGQIMSMRQDMLPAAYCRELSKLRTEVSPMPFDEVRQVIEEEYDTRLERVFASFDRQPLGAASIAQAHAAVLRDGSPVVVKVQRQGIRDVMARDIQLLRKAARILKAASSAGNALDFGVILNEMWAVAQQKWISLSRPAMPANSTSSTRTWPM